MIRTVLSRAVPRLSPPAVCRYSAAAIPAPNAEPEVHFNKVLVPGFSYCAITTSVCRCAAHKRNKSLGARHLIVACFGFFFCSFVQVVCFEMENVRAEDQTSQCLV